MSYETKETFSKLLKTHHYKKGVASATKKAKRVKKRTPKTKRRIK